MKKLISSILLVFLTGCATVQVAPLKVTDSGLPERIVTGSTVDDIRNAIIQSCYRGQSQVEETSNTTVICSKEMQGGAAVMVQLMLGNSYADTPRMNLKFQILKLNDKDIKVIVVPTYSTRMINGKINSMQVTNQADLNSVQVQLEKFKVNSVAQ